MDLICTVLSSLLETILCCFSFSPTQAKKKRKKNPKKPTQLSVKPSMQMRHGLPQGTHVSSARDMDCLHSAGLPATYLYRLFYTQYCSSLMKVSLKATGYLFQPVHKVDASDASIYLLKKGQLMRMSWLKELNECCLKITVKRVLQERN